MLSQPATPFVYEVVEPTTAQTTVVDVVLGAVAVAGAVAVVALVLGLALAGVMIGIRRMRGDDGLTGRDRQGASLGLGG
ncbi:MAG: hypothetical protein OXQ28_14915 [Acidobacteriota bacterium]|nr:hypothetical protein [Acidobacteriota bacterium]